MYEAHFKLKSSPFGMTPDPNALYWTAGHREALAGLTYAIMRRKGFVVLSGAAGTGKTTLLRKLMDSPPVEMRTSYVYNPTLTPSEFLELALTDFDMPPVSMNKAQRLLKLEQFLLAMHKEGKVVVLIIDEAHKLSPELLEEVRLLTNFETAKEKLLQIVLAGQPELDGILNRPDLWQLKQRIAVRLQIRPLSGPDIRQYLRFRWTKAGGPEPLPFSDETMDLIGNCSKGIPRIINGICDNSLVLAYGAGSETVTTENVLEVVKDLGLRPETDGARRPAAAAHLPVAGPQAAMKAPATNGRVAVAKPAALPVAAKTAPVVEHVPLERYVDKEEEDDTLFNRWAERLGFRVRRTAEK